ncbi:isopropylmalate isomerase [Sedimentitalea sp. HM32M-2]
MTAARTPRLDLQDRSRLRERFFGATRTVQARP